MTKIAVVGTRNGRSSERLADMVGNITVPRILVELGIAFLGGQYLTTHVNKKTPASSIPGHAESSCHHRADPKTVCYRVRLSI